MFVDRDECALYTLEKGATRTHKETFNLVQDLRSNVNAALRALSKNFLEDIFNAVFFLEL